MADERFGARPYLLVVDGGKPQLTAALTQLEGLGLDIPVCGLAKADEEVFVPWDETPVVLPNGSASLYLIKQVRDDGASLANNLSIESWRQGHDRFRARRGRGRGAHAQAGHHAALWFHEEAPRGERDEIAAVKGVPRHVAEDVYRTLRAWDAEREAGRADGCAGEHADGHAGSAQTTAQASTRTVARLWLLTLVRAGTTSHERGRRVYSPADPVT